MFAKSELWFQESVNCPPERLFAGQSNNTVNIEDHRQKHETSGMPILRQVRTPLCTIDVFRY
jgi:hypothetical protein